MDIEIKDTPYNDRCCGNCKHCVKTEKNASTNLKISEIFAIIIIESERGINYEFKLLEVRFNTRKRVSCTL